MTKHLDKIILVAIFAAGLLAGACLILAYMSGG